MPTNPPTPRTYYIHQITSGGKTGWLNAPHVGLRLFYTQQDANRYFQSPDTDVVPVVVLPVADYKRLLAIEAAARNAMENSWHIDTPHPDCACHEWRGCTVVDDKDAKELKEALTPASRTRR